MLPVTTTSTPLGYQPGLDGLRGLFVLAVLFFHGGFGWASGGFLGVSAFFTLSGFLICTLLVDERADRGRIDLVQFWTRRARRLLPAAWLALAGALAFGATLASPAVQRALQGDVLAALAYVANWRFVATGDSYEALFSEPSPVTHLWSLAIEEQFYLVFPLLVAGVLALGRGRRWVLGLVLAALALGSSGLMAVLHDPTADTARVYYGTDTRAAELLIGALAALLWRRWRLSSMAMERSGRSGIPLQLAAIGAVVGIGWAWSHAGVASTWLYRGGFALHALGVVVVLLAALAPGPIRAGASWEPLRRLGLISYGVYLYHWPIFLWLNPARTGLDGWTLFGVRIVTTLAVATLSYAIVEQPIRRRRVLRSWRGVLAAPVAGAVLLGAIAAVPTPAPSLMDAVSFGEEVDPFDVLDLDVVPPPAPDTDDDRDEARPPRVAVFGDSTAIGVFNGLLHVDSTSGRIVAVPGSMNLGCALVRAEALRYDGAVYPLTDTCSTWPEKWTDAITRGAPDVAVVLFGPWDTSDRVLPGGDEWTALGDPTYDEFARAEIRAALEVLTSQVDQVVWLLSPRVDQTRGQPGRTDQEPGSDPSRMARWNELVSEEIATYPPDQATTVDLGGWFEALPGGPFDPEIRPDGVHIADSHAPVVGEWIATELVTTWSARTDR